MVGYASVSTPSKCVEAVTPSDDGSSVRQRERRALEIASNGGQDCPIADQAGGRVEIMQDARAGGGKGKGKAPWSWTAWL